MHNVTYYNNINIPPLTAFASGINMHSILLTLATKRRWRVTAIVWQFYLSV